MSIGFLFWLLMVLWFIFGAYRSWPGGSPDPRLLAGGSLLEFVLLFLLGWKVFGFVIQS
jgi:hypothetical protein